MRFIKDYFWRFFGDYFLERRQEKVDDQAHDLAQKEKYAEAAAVYTRFAPEYLEHTSLGFGELMYCSYCIYAFEMWIKARNAVNALEQARNVLRILSRNDGSWLKYKSGEKAVDLLKLVSKLYAAGYTAEADVFSREVNDQLEKNELPMWYLDAPMRKSKFPSLCTHCGAKLPYSPNKEIIECSHCDTIIYAQ